MPKGIPKNGINNGWFKKGQGKTNKNDYFCKYCGKDLRSRKNKTYICSNCSWKNKYFGGLYWDVLKRDNYTCVICKKNGYKKTRVLNVHHINHNNKDNRIENLETLCINCHARKRKFICKDCGYEFIATGARQLRCSSCSKIHNKIKSYVAQAKYWKNRNYAKHQWYMERIKNPNYLRYRKIDR